MAWTMWAFQFKDDQWSRVPWKWYDRFFDGKVAAKESEGTRLRFALIAVELDDREPERAEYPSFFVHEAAAEGLLNKEREDMVRRVAVEMTFGGLGRASEVNVIAASARFARRQHENFAKWAPTHDQNEALLRLLRSLGVPC